MNSPFIDARQVDWEDGLNPDAIPAYRRTRNPFVYRALNNPTTRQLRDAPGMTMTLRAAPNDPVSLLQPFAANNTGVPIRPGSWIIGLSASSSQPEGFRVQLTQGNGQAMFSVPLKSTSLRGRPVYLAKPQGLTDPQVTVTISNLSPAANTCQLCLWIVEPI